MEGQIGIGVAIIGSLVSGLVGVIVTNIVHARRESRKSKLDTLRRFAENRYDLKGDEFTRALNEILFSFNDSKEVEQSLIRFHEPVTQGPTESEEALLRLYKSMCRAAKVDISSFNDSFFLRPFNTRPTSTQATNRPGGA